MTLALKQLLFGVALPAAASIALLLAARPWRAGALDSRWSAAARVLAVTLGVLAAQIALLERIPQLWPPGIPGRFPAAVLAIMFGELAVVMIARPYAAIGVRAALAAFLLYALLWPLAKHWPAGRAIGVTASLGIAMAAGPMLLDGIAKIRPGATVPLVVWSVASTTAIALMLSYTASLGQLSGALAAITGPIVLLAWWKPATPATGAAPAAAAVLGSLLLIGNLTAGLTPLRAVLLGVAPLACGVALIPIPGTRHKWLAPLGALTIATVMAGTAVALAARVYEAPE